MGLGMEVEIEDAFELGLMLAGVEVNWQLELLEPDRARMSLKVADVVFMSVEFCPDNGSPGLLGYVRYSLEDEDLFVMGKRTLIHQLFDQYVRAAFEAGRAVESTDLHRLFQAIVRRAKAQHMRQQADEESNVLFVEFGGNNG